MMAYSTSSKCRSSLALGSYRCLGKANDAQLGFKVRAGIHLEDPEMLSQE